MRFIVILIALAAFLITVALLSSTGRKRDVRQRRIDDACGLEHHERRDDIRGSLSKRISQQISSMLDHDGNKTHVLERNNQHLERLARDLKTAGLHISAWRFYRLKLTLLAVLPLLSLGICALLEASALIMTLCVIIGLIVAVLIPRLIVSKSTKKRQESISADLPNVMDMLIVSVEAGLGFDAAVRRLYERDKSPLMQELIDCQNEVAHGVQRRDAMNAMAQRCDVKEFSTFVSAMVQADELGVSIKSILQAQAESLRRERHQKIEQKASSAPIKMMLPTVLFIFPTIFIIVLAPTAVNMIRMLT